jgi:predicted small secreted protein
MKRALLALTCALVLAGCDSAQSTADKLRVEIGEFKNTPDDKKQALIEEHFAKLETQLAALQKRGDAKAGAISDQLTSLKEQYQTAKLAKALTDAKNAIQGFGQAVKDTAKDIQQTFQGNQTNK